MQNHNVSLLERLEAKGRLFYVSNVLAAQGTPVSFLWRVGSKAVSFASSVQSTLKTTYTITEAPTVTVPGTIASLLNKNRNFPDDGLVFRRYTGPAVTGGTGTLISTEQTGATSAPGQASDSPAASTISTLKKNTDYVVTVTPSASNDITIKLLFWEDDE